MKTLHLALILLSLSGVLTQYSGWDVKYTEKSICAVRGFSVSIPCSYYYATSNPIQVTQRLWCSNHANTKGCTDKLYVYDSTSKTKSDFKYVGDVKSNCTLLIHNVQFSYSGTYKFRFITNAPNGSWTGEPGVTLQVGDLKVSLIRLSGNGTLKQGDSLNLTCDVNCTHSSSQFVWSKNNEQLNPSGPVLHFPALTVRDSGNYTCTWKTKETSGSKTISLQVEGGWGVNYTDNPICAVRGFSVSIPCSYYYPTSNPNIQVKQRLWCSMNSNTDYGCHGPPYVYDSSSNTKSDFEYVGDDKSNCTLLIHNVQFSYSGEYKFRFITDEPSDRWTGQPGVTLQTGDLKVSLIRLSGNGTLKQGDSLNLTCDVNCTHSSSQFVWSKNNEQLNTSGPVLHFPALTVRDSGNYTCTWKTKETSGSKTISLQVEGGWDVKYHVNPICAVRGFSVSIPCSYYYPTSNPNIQVTQTLWCSMNSNRDVCETPPYVYDSTSNITSDFEYVGDDKSNCTLLIHNVQFSYSGEYRFRFITDVPGGRWTGKPGVNLQTADLKVSLIRLSGNGTLKQGDSLNLTCDVNCTHSSSQFVWSKNNEQLNTSGPVLHFPALTVRDSGNYTCTWKTNETSGSKTISLQVEDPWLIWMIVLVTAAVILIVILGAVIYNRRRKFKAAEENRGESGEKTQKKSQLHQVSQDPDEETLSNEEVIYASARKKAKTKESQVTAQINQVSPPDEEVTYASVCVKPNKPTKQRVHTEQQEEDDSVIYSTVKTA
ncbi:B-cell receptor CD22-like [Clarias gariepinus]